MALLKEVFALEDCRSMISQSATWYHMAILASNPCHLRSGPSGYTLIITNEDRSLKQERHMNSHQKELRPTLEQVSGQKPLQEEEWDVLQKRSVRSNQSRSR
jgi:hypothetical protein